MSKEEIIAKLLEHRSELEAAGVEHLSLFGSVARGDDGPGSDLDIVVKLSDPIILSGFDYITALMDLKDRLEGITRKSVDVISEPMRNERFKTNLERDRIVAF